MIPRINTISKEKLLKLIKSKRAILIGLVVVAIFLVPVISIFAFQKRNDRQLATIEVAPKKVQESISPTPLVSVTTTPTKNINKGKTTLTPTPTKKPDNSNNNPNSGQNGNANNTTAPTSTPLPTSTPVSSTSTSPTSTPTKVPTNKPTSVSTTAPTIAPTAVPTTVPTATPTLIPTATPTTSVTAKPDFVITGARINQEPMKAGNWNYILVDIKNQGTAKNLFMSNIYAFITGANGGTTSCEVGLESYDPGQSYTTSLHCIVYDTGIANAEIKIDANNRISELDEGNNTYTFSFNVSP